MLRKLLKGAIVIIGLLMVTMFALLAWKRHSAFHAFQGLAFALAAIAVLKSLRHDKQRSLVLKDAQGFSLPKDQVLGLASFWIPGAGLVLVFALYALITWQVFLIGMNALLVAGLYWAVRYVGTYKWVFISPSGISGRDTSGGKVNALWSDPLFITDTSYSGIAGFRLTRSSDKAAIFVPASIVSSEAFQAAMHGFAPADHALLKLGSRQNNFRESHT